MADGRDEPAPEGHRDTGEAQAPPLPATPEQEQRTGRFERPVRTS